MYMLAGPILTLWPPMRITVAVEASHGSNADIISLSEWLLSYEIELLETGAESSSPPANQDMRRNEAKRANPISENDTKST